MLDYMQFYEKLKQQAGNNPYLLNVCENYRQQCEVATNNQNDMQYCNDFLEKVNAVCSFEEEPYGNGDKILQAKRGYKRYDFVVTHFDEIPPQSRLDVMIMCVYRNNIHFRFQDFMYHKLPYCIKNEPLEKRGRRIKSNRKAIQKLLDNQDCLTIYRGCSVRNWNYKFALSWTTDKRIANAYAEWGALHSDRKKYIVTAKVNFDDILYYFRDYNLFCHEKEIVLNPSRKLNLISAE